MTDQNFNQSSELSAIKNDNKGWQLVAEAGWLVGQHFPIAGHKILGRDGSCDITIPGTHLSRQHAELVCTGAKLMIRDLDSSNGTYVNEKRIKEAELFEGDTVRFDVLTFRVKAPVKEIDLNATMIRKAPLQGSSVKVKSSVTKSNSDSLTTPNNSKKPNIRKNDHLTDSGKLYTTTTEASAFSVINTLAVLVSIAIIASIGFLISQL